MKTLPSTFSKRTLVAAILALVVLNVTGAAAFDLESAVLEKPVLAPAGGSDPFPFSSGLLGDDVALTETRSTSKAVLYSLLLPGLGQWYLGEKTPARVFFAIDVAIWTSFIVFNVQSELREDEYQQYARTFAGVTSLDHSDDYYGILTQYDSFQNYEDDVKSDGRFELYPDIDVAALDQYFIENRVADYELWVWQSADHRRAYQDRRSASKRADRRALYTLAAAAANRVASAFFAYRTTRRQQQEENAQQTGFSIELGAPQRHASEGFQPGISLIRNF